MASAAFTAADTGVYETGSAVYGSEQQNVSLGTYLGEHVLVPFFGILGVIFFVLTLYSGILWMISGGNAENLKKAKSILIHAVIGLIVIMLSYGLTQFIMGAIV